MNHKQRRNYLRYAKILRSQKFQNLSERSVRISNNQISGLKIYLRNQENVQKNLNISFENLEKSKRTSLKEAGFSSNEIETLIQKLAESYVWPKKLLHDID